MLSLYQIFLRRQVEKEDTAWKESRFIAGIFDNVTTALQVILCESTMFLM